MLTGHLDELTSLTLEQRLEEVRQVVVELCALKATVKTFLSFTGPTSCLSVSGVGTLFSDASHPTTPAVAVADERGGATFTRHVILLSVEARTARGRDDYAEFSPFSSTQAGE